MTAKDFQGIDRETYKQTKIMMEYYLSKVNGEDDTTGTYATLAKELSEDKVSAANGGLMSGFNTDQVDEAFFKAANKLEDGKMTKEPVKDSKGYNVILKVSSAEKPKLETVKDNIIETLAEEKLNASSSAFNDAWYQIRKKYKLDIVDTDVKTLYKANYEK